MDEKLDVLKRGTVAGAAAFVVGVVAITPVTELVSPSGEIMGFEYVYAGVLYAIGHIVYLPSDGFFPVTRELSLAASTAFYTLPSALLLVSGYLVEKRSSSGSTRRAWLRGSSVASGYLGSLMVALIVIVVTTNGFGLPSIGEMLVFVVIPFAVYAFIFGGLGGLMSHVGQYDDGSFRETADQVRNLTLVIALVSLVVVSGIAVTPDQDVVHSHPTSGVSFDVDSLERNVSVSVVSMGNADHVIILGDHTLDGDPVLNETGATVVLPEENLEESGSVTAVSVIGDVEIGRDEGYTVAVEIDERATETGLQTEEWDFRSTR